MLSSRRIGRNNKNYFPCMSQMSYETPIVAGLQNTILPTRPIVCLVHFRHEDIDRTSSVYVKLKKHAVPYVTKEYSIFKTLRLNKDISTEEPSTSEIIKEENINVCEDISTEEPSTSTSSAVIILQTGDSVGFTESMSVTGRKRKHLVDTGSHEVSEKVLTIASESKNEHMGALLQTSNKSAEAKVSVADKHTCISPEKLFHSPRKEMLRKHISNLKRKHQLEFANLNAKINRRNQKITNLQTVLQTLQTKNSNDQYVLYDHRIRLIKCIINNYVKVRYNYICKQKNNVANSKRNYFNKLILFSGH
ncbi:uncharacterized protein LOC143217915 [Lasioglossum baleicum]|uniref:uncharacterized protein LOC143217915 n=1 Tax=Lasioglossum baleicum TaxID=434251 RepID=UPI003FCDCAA6